MPAPVPRALVLAALLAAALAPARARAQAASVPDRVVSVAPPDPVPTGAAGLQGGFAPVDGIGGVPAPSVDEVLQAMRRAVRQDTELKGGYFLLLDSSTSRVRALRSVRIRPEVHWSEGATALRILKRFRGGNPAALPKGVGRVYYACADFADVKTKETLDVDIWMAWGAGGLEPVQYALHKLDGKPRFEYAARERERLGARAEDR